MRLLEYAEWPHQMLLDYSDWKSTHRFIWRPGKYKRAKFEIVEGLKPGGVAVFNKAAGEDDLIRWAKDLKIKSVVYEDAGRKETK